MPKLKLKGPRRRESDRVKNQSESTSPAESETPENVSMIDAQENTHLPSKQSVSQSVSHSASPLSIDVDKAAATSNTQSGADFVSSSSPDTIKVQHKVAAIEISDSTDGSSPPSELDDDNEEAAGVTFANPSTGTEIANDDTELMHEHDQVEEYDFRNDSDDGEEDNYDDGRDTEWYKNPGKIFNPVITISSDSDKDEGGSEWNLNDRPWKNFDLKTRKEYERMYCNVTKYAMKGDWEVTEDYQREKDSEMLRYMEDFPLPQWVLPQAEVQAAYQGLVERSRWRNLGIGIYEYERRASGTNFNMQAMQMQSPLNMSSAAYARQMAQYSQLSQNVPSAGQFRTVNGLPVPNAAQSVSQLSSHQVLRSQPMAQSMPAHGSGMPSYQPMGGLGMVQGMASSPMQHAGGVYNTTMGPMPPPSQKTMRSKHKKSETPPNLAQAQPAKTPPYDLREKPAERRTANKSGRKNMRRVAEADEFPWNRNLDFPTIKSNASWDDSIYDPATLEGMAATRLHNEPIIERIDAEEAERQRKSKKRKQDDQKADSAGNNRNAKKNGANADGSSDFEGRKKPGPRRKSSAKVDGGENSLGDPYHSGQYCFATADDQRRAEALFGAKSPDDIMDAVELGQASVDSCTLLIICWNPGKRGILQGIRQCRFSIKDTLLTRQKLATTPILTRRAAECIVDFCPDLLWRSMLLRIASEGGYGNKDVRDRMCLNGNYCDKATITKRIGSALGQKQQQSAAKRAAKGDPPSESSVEKVQGYAKADMKFYNDNVEDFGNYCEYFGFRSSHRLKLVQKSTGSKRKADVLNDVEEDVGGTTEEEVVKGFSEDGDDPDAVSVQSDTLLDEMDED